MKLAIIGAGPMGRALYEGAKEEIEDVLLVDKNREKLDGAKHASQDMGDAKKAEIVIIAVKPRAFKEMFFPDALIISVMAGVPLKAIENVSRSRRVIRAMPNLASRVGEGLTAWVGTEHVLGEDKTQAKRLFRSMGQEMELASEDLVDRFAAIAGCGPAYICYLLEAMEDQAGRFGFSAKDAKLMARQTCKGVAKLLEGGDPTFWLSAVTSKGGMTEAAMTSFHKARLKEAIQKGIQRAEERGKELFPWH